MSEYLISLHHMNCNAKAITFYSFKYLQQDAGSIFNSFCQHIIFLYFSKLLRVNNYKRLTKHLLTYKLGKNFQTLTVIVLRIVAEQMKLITCSKIFRFSCYFFNYKLKYNFMQTTNTIQDNGVKFVVGNTVRVYNDRRRFIIRKKCVQK